MLNLFSKIRKIALSKEGISFPMLHDNVTWLWPWGRMRKTCNIRYYSERYRTFFSSLRDYRTYIATEKTLISNSHKEKVYGFSLRTLVEVFSRIMYPNKVTVILTNINYEARASTFWNQLPAERLKVFSSDFVAMICSSKTEAVRIAESISEDFATAFVCTEHGLIFCNLWR